MIWMFFAFMVLVSVLIIFIPLFQRPKSKGAGKNEIIEIYKAQLKDIELEKQRGLLNQAQAQTAQLEIERRLIKAHEKKDEITVFGGVVFPIIMSGLLIILGFFFYINTGNPTLTTSSQNGVFSEATNAESDIEEILKKLELHLKANPDDIQGWGLMATSRAKQGKYFEASSAFGRAFDLSGDVNFLIQQGEVLINIAGGQMTPASNLAFGTAMKLAPENPAPIYYLGLGRFQSGNIEGALSVWEDLLETSNDTDPWVPNLKSQINRARVELGGANAGIQNMSPEDQEEFIESMISSLRSKLTENPSDLEGWLRLARAEIVKGRLELGLEALLKAEALANGELKLQISQEIKKLKTQQVK